MYDVELTSSLIADNIKIRSLAEISSNLAKRN